LKRSCASRAAFFRVSSSLSQFWAENSGLSIDVHVSNLRRKLGVPQDGQRIKAVRGSGYLFAPRPNAKDAGHA
jgi:DNA-binding response OmpR family regulator